MAKLLSTALLLLALAGCATIAPAPKQEPRVAVLNEGQVVVAIVDEPCKFEDVLQHILPEFQKHFKAGGVSFHGQPVNLCWAEGEKFLDLEPALMGHILVFDAQGNYGPIPAVLFNTTIDPRQNTPKTAVRRGAPAPSQTF